HTHRACVKRRSVPQVADILRPARPGSISHFPPARSYQRQHLGTDGRCVRRTDGRYGGGRGAEPGTVRATMTYQRIKVCLLTAACPCLVGLCATDASAQLFKHHGSGGDCCNPCPNPCANPCGPGAAMPGPGAPGAPGAGGPCAPGYTTQKVQVTEMRPTYV